MYVKYMSKYTQTYIQIHVPENPLPRKYITNSYKPAWHRLSEMYILNLDHFSEFQTQIFKSFPHLISPLNVSKGAEISLKLNFFVFIN